MTEMKDERREEVKREKETRLDEKRQEKRNR